MPEPIELPNEEEALPAPEKVYLGDSVYGSYDGEYIRLTTENGLPGDPSNSIGLERAVIRKLKEYILRVEQFEADWIKRHP